jgi:hypothetical protein
VALAVEFLEQAIDRAVFLRDPLLGRLARLVAADVEGILLVLGLGLVRLLLFGFRLARLEFLLVGLGLGLWLLLRLGRCRRLLDGRLLGQRLDILAWIRSASCSRLRPPSPGSSKASSENPSSPGSLISSVLISRSSSCR